jgi:hypothetical protein
MSNESKWLTAIGGIVAAIVPLLVAYGVITQEQGTLWENLVLAIAAAVVPIVVASLIRNYNDNDAATTVAKLETEQAWITSGALDNATPVRE